MERLTFKLGNTYGLENKASSKAGLFIDYDGFFAYFVATNQLGKYEDIGLTPEEVIKLQQENTELKELLRLAVETLNDFALSLRENSNKDTACCGYCEYADCAYLGAEGDRCGECPGFEKEDCFKWQHADKLKELGVK